MDPSAIQNSLHVYDLNQRKDEVFIPGVTAYALSADRKKLLYRTREASFIVATAAKPQPNQGRLNVEAVEVRVVPTAEWRQIFDEAWRVNRDFFYDRNMHGADWKAMKAKYEVFLPHLACRNDLNRLIQWMCSELAVGHHRGGGGDTFVTQARRVPGGLLGADYEIRNGRYRFKKVYGGLNWNPDLRSPLTEPGVDVKEGEYLLAVEGRDLREGENLFARFENTSGKIVELTVGPNPDGKGSRTVRAVPIASEAGLRNRDWVEGNLKKVHEATSGRVAYVYVPDTATFGHIYFKRYFFPQADKDAVIVDERFNGGGSIADYYIDHLRKPLIAYWAMRYGADLKTPSASIQGPKVMLINESAGSGGDLLPWMWRKFGLGQLIGTRTWGGLVGVLGFPVLMDGGGITAPNVGIWTEDGFVVENVGVPADIEVEQTPQDVMAGRDPQLEKAIQVVLEELKKNPPRTPRRPPFPIRVRK
jgi:tricorn protease